ASSQDRTDSFTVSYQQGNSGSSGDQPASNSLTRFSLEIVGITPPTSTAAAGQTLSPVLSVTNHSTSSQTLTASQTSLSGSAFGAPGGSTGTKGPMATLSANGGTGTVTFSGAAITTATGSKTVDGDAASGTTA